VVLQRGFKTKHKKIATLQAITNNNEQHRCPPHDRVREQGALDLLVGSFPSVLVTADLPSSLSLPFQSLDFTPHDTKWIPGTSRIVCTGISPSSKGALRIYELERDGTKELFQDLSFRPQGIKCSTFGASRLASQHLAMGDYGGTLSICDLERAISNDNKPKKQIQDTTVEIFSMQGHTGIVNAIDGIGGTSCSCGAPELATGGKDGCVKIWDPRVNQAVVTLDPDKASCSRDCWSVAFGNSYNYDERSILAGFDNGDVKLFDLRTNTMRWETNCKNGVTSVQFDRQDIEMNKIVVTTLESKFRCYDARTQHSEDGLEFLSERAHRSTVWTAKHLPQNRDIFMTGGGNGGFNIYKYHYPQNRIGKHAKDGTPVGVIGSVELLNSRVISTQPIVSFDWSPDREGLCCMSALDQSLR
jgi:WD40 repeat protein